MLDTLEQVFREGRAAVFCGAGISAPSGIPLAAPLIEATLDVLGATADEKRHLDLRSLPFEAFMETLRLEGTHEDHLLLFREGSPCLAHQLFAALRVKTIATTNFDLLFERAGVPSGVIKLHGSVDDLENMAVTLRQVAAQTLTLPRAQAIRTIFADGPHDAVLVIGYSASDRFDLNPAIAAHPAAGKQLFVVDHVEGKAEIEPLPLSAVESPFRNYRGSRLRCDANWLLRELWQRLLGTAPPPTPAPLPLLDRWRDELRRFPPAAKDAAVGTLLFRVAQYELAVARYRRALGDLPDAHARTYVSMKLGNALRNLGHLRDAVTAYEQAVELARSSGDLAAEHHALSALAGGLLNLGEVRATAPLFERALRLADQAGLDRQSVGETLGLLAEAFWRAGDFAQAEMALGDAIAIARETGDLRGLSGRLGNLAVLHMQNRRLAEAEEALNESREIARLAGDLKGEAFVLGSLARLALGHDAYAEARALNERALELFRALGDRQGEARILGNLGLAWEALGDRMKALECYAESRRVAIDIGDQQVLHAAVQNLARLGFG